MVQDTADLWNTDHVQLEGLFRKLLTASSAATTDPSFGSGGLGGIACSAAQRGNFRAARKLQVRLEHCPLPVRRDRGTSDTMGLPGKLMQLERLAIFCVMTVEASQPLTYRSLRWQNFSGAVACPSASLQWPDSWIRGIDLLVL